jgi:hypothetical protein
MISVSKRLVIGGTLALAFTGAQAADFPVKAKPVEYVKVCSLYGAGFYYIPGTDICLRVGGYVRAQLEWGAGSGGLAYGSVPFAANGRFTREAGSDLNYTLRAVVSTESRQQTAYGTLRSYLALGFTSDTNDTSGANVNTVYANRAFIQLAGFTVGRAVSYFENFMLYNVYSYADVLTSGDTSTFGAEVFAYTAQFGNGVSASLSIENPASRGRAGVLDGSQAAFAVNGVTTPDNLKFRSPDVVANLRIDQAWGYLAVSAAAHEASGAYYGTANNQNNGHPSDKWGWAASVGGRINLPGGDSFGASAVYSKGAARYAAKAGSWQMYGQDSVGVGWVSDGIFDNLSGIETGIELTEVWSVNAAYEHVWSPNWRTSVYGGYTEVNYNAAAEAIVNAHLPGAAGTIRCGVPVAGAVWPPINLPVGGGGNSCSPDYSYYQIGSRTQWNPVSGLDIGLDVFYTHLNTAYKGVATGIYPANNARPAVNSIDDQDNWSAIVRWQRSFFP